MESKAAVSRPSVGIRVCVINDEGKILLEKRKKSSVYRLPGGHLERLESWEECARRELKEETCLDIEEKAFKFIVANNIIEPEKDFHYTNAILVCRFPKDQKIVNSEPEKCEGWEWWTIEEIEAKKANMFKTIQLLLDLKEEVFNLKHLNQKLDQ